MDMTLSDEDRVFRDAVRAFLDEALDSDIRRAERLHPGFLSDIDIARRWQGKLHENGWVAPGWPKQFGGTGWTISQRYIFDQECERAGEPHIRGAGIRMLAPVLMHYGTDAQQSYHLPRILSGEHIWAQGYSEPGAGSDLASLSMQAVADGDDYILNGSKMWTSFAHKADWMFALVRTSSEEVKQRGITFLVIDMQTPGITVRPIRAFCGTHEYNQVYFDNVRVPLGNRIGDAGQGWDIAKYLLEFERGSAFAGGMLRGMLTRLCDQLRMASPDGSRRIDDPLVAARLAEIGTDIDAIEVLELSIMSKLEAGGSPGAVPASIMKIERSRIRQAIAELTATSLGTATLRWEPHRPLHDLPKEAHSDEVTKVAAAAYFNSRSQTIFGGTTEMQLEIIARQLLS